VEEKAKTPKGPSVPFQAAPQDYEEKLVGTVHMQLL